MKKIKVSHKFKKRQLVKKKRLFRKNKNRERRVRLEQKRIAKSTSLKRKKKNKKALQDSGISAPKDFRLIENTEQCLAFFRELREQERNFEILGRDAIMMNLHNVEQIDYGTVSIVNAISDDLRSNNILLQGNFPKNMECRNFLIDSGFLNHMYIRNQRVAKSENSDLIFFEKGSGKLSVEDGKKIGELIKNVVFHLTGKKSHNQKLRTVILEVCGNSIEHASTPKRQWLLGINYQPDRVIFTVSDVGKGILETLHRKFGLHILDKLSFRKDHEILAGAFRQKYGSSTLEANRNKGLPAVRAAFENGTIQNLITITNNAVLNFSNESLSRTLPKGSPRFKGTFYQWEVNSQCIK